MFIYSNHYLIISRLTREDYPDYFNFHNHYWFNKKNTKLTSTCLSDVEEIDYCFHDFIDLTISYTENDEMLLLLKDPAVTFDHAKFIKVCRISLPDNDDIYKNNVIMNDMMHYTAYNDPFVTCHWTKRGLYFYDKKASKKDQEIQKQKIVEQHHLKIVYKDQSFESIYFPENEKQTYFLDDNFDFVKTNEQSSKDFRTVIIEQYQFEELNEIDRLYERWTNVDNHLIATWSFHDEGKDGIINHLISIDMGVDDDSSEYWHEPIFIFPLIREIDTFRILINGPTPKKRIFDEFYTSPCSNQWFEISEYDIGACRNTCT